MSSSDDEVKGKTATRMQDTTFFMAHRTSIVLIEQEEIEVDYKGLRE